MKIRMIEGRISIMAGAAETKAIKEVAVIFDMIEQTGARVYGDDFAAAVGSLVDKIDKAKAAKLFDADEKT